MNRTEIIAAHPIEEFVRQQGRAAQGIGVLGRIRFRLRVERELRHGHHPFPVKQGGQGEPAFRSPGVYAWDAGESNNV